MHKAPVILLLFAIVSLLLLSSCGSARHLQEVRKVDSTAVDRSTIIIRDTVIQVVNQVITQTVVEYYPVYDTVYLQTPEVAVPVSGEIASCTAAAPPVPQPIKSITWTEIRTDAALQSSKDSVALMDADIHLKTLSDTDSKEGEPAYIKTLRLVAVILALLLLLFLVIKLRSILR